MFLMMVDMMMENPVHKFEAWEYVSFFDVDFSPVWLLYIFLNSKPSVLKLDATISSQED